MNLQTIFLILIFNVSLSLSANILVLCPVGSRSHKNVIEPVIQVLITKHTVTMVSSFKTAITHPNFRDLQVMDGFDYYKNTNSLTIRQQGASAAFEDDVMNVVLEACHTTYKNKEFMGLLNQTWDLVLLDAFDNHCLQGFIYKLQAPVIWFMPIPSPAAFAIKLGTYFPPSFVPDPFLPFGESMTLWERLQNFVLPIHFYHLYFSSFDGFEKHYRAYLGDDSIPEISKLDANVSLMLANSHYLLHHPRPTMPDIIEIGGIHCRPGKPLPEDLENFIKGSPEGVVLFSLGSIFKGKDMPEATRKFFVNSFSKLKQRVLWKWDFNEMEDLPNNVKLSKWLPLQDVLAHPNVKVFITHGGLMSTQEAIYHGVPLVGVPIVADQDLNINRFVKAGIAVSLEILDLSEEQIVDAVNTVLNNPSYTENVQKMSKTFRDQPQSPLDRAVFWCEYVLRHRGGGALRSVARDLNFVQYHSLDVIGILVVMLISFIWGLLVICRRLLNRCCT